jgi:hypothetical protein
MSDEADREREAHRAIRALAVAERAATGETLALLVGESNPYRAEERFALYPWPPNCAGHRLQERVMGVSVHDYFHHYRRVNLCAGPWDSREAEKSCVAILCGKPVPAPVVVLLGKRVAEAFGVGMRVFPVHPSDVAGSTRLATFCTTLLRLRIPEPRTVKVVCLPHPSGLARPWNEPGAFERARDVLREAGNPLLAPRDLWSQANRIRSLWTVGLLNRALPGDLVGRGDKDYRLLVEGVS